MERDDNVGSMHDAANDIDELADQAYDEWRQRRDDEREMAIEEALDDCKARGVSIDHLKTLVFETGATHWGLKNSLKVPEPRREGFKDY